MSKATNSLPSGKLNLYDRLVAACANVERKGATMPYTSVNGHMFSFLTKDGKLALRLPAQEREAFLKQHKAKLCEQHGTVLKEYVEVPDALLKKPAELQTYFEQSHAYAASLKPRPAAKKRSTAKKPAVKSKAKKNKSAKKRSG